MCGSCSTVYKPHNKSSNMCGTYKRLRLCSAVTTGLRKTKCHVRQKLTKMLEPSKEFNFTQSDF